MISRRNAALCGALAACCAGVVLSPAPPGLRVAFGVPFVLVLPGYALTAALFATARLRQTDVLLLTIALSLSLVGLGTLGLNWLPGRLTATTWTALLMAGTALAAVWAFVRIPAGTGRRAFPPGLLTTRQVGLLAIALLITVGAIVFARRPLPARGVHGYTALWIVAQPPGSRTIRVGVQSSEVERTSYLLAVRTDRGELLQRRLTLAPRERWTYRLAAGRSSHRVDADLFRSDSPSRVYRRVRLLLTAPPAAP